MSISTLGKVGIGLAALGVVAGAGVLLAGCGKEVDPDSFVLDEFQDFDRSPRDNNWTPNELQYQSQPRTSTREYGTYRVGDMVFGTREIRSTTTTHDMSRIYAAAKGNDAVLSLQELRDFAVSRFDRPEKDGPPNGTLGGKERDAFQDQFGTTQRSQTVIIGTEPFSRYSPQHDHSSHDHGGSYPRPDNGDTSNGDDGGRGPTSGGDDGGYTPAPAPAPAPAPPSNSGGNSTDNGNPSEDDF